MDFLPTFAQSCSHGLFANISYFKSLVNSLLFWIFAVIVQSGQTIVVVNCLLTFTQYGQKLVVVGYLLVFAQSGQKHVGMGCLLTVAQSGQKLVVVRYFWYLCSLVKNL